MKTLKFVDESAGEKGRVDPAAAFERDAAKPEFPPQNAERRRKIDLA